MVLHRYVALAALMAMPLGIVAAAQQFPTAPAIPQVTPPAAGGESLAATELRIALQKAQIQSALADRIAQAKDEILKSLQEKEGAGAVEVGRSSMHNVMQSPRGRRQRARSSMF